MLDLVPISCNISRIVPRAWHKILELKIFFSADVVAYQVMRQVILYKILYSIEGSINAIFKEIGDYIFEYVLPAFKGSTV